MAKKVNTLTLRDKRQKEFADVWLNNDKFGILNLCPRFGKIYTTINILEQLPKDISILIAYPDLKIKSAWEQDFLTRKYKNTNIIYTTHLSIKKHADIKFDLVIIDEIHLLSEAQIEVCVYMFNKHSPNVLGLTGTLSSQTEETLGQELDLPVLATYSIEQAIKEGVITDYEIRVISVPLDNKIEVNYKGKMKTEKKQFDAYGWVIDQMERQKNNTMFLRLARMRIIQNSLAKLNKTKELLSKHKDERILVFCGVTKIADDLGIPVYHSKAGDKEVFEDFASGGGNHLAVVKIGNTGVTYKPLNRVIINYFDSNAENLAQKINRCMAMEYNTPDKKAHIYIICSTEEVEKKWLRKALEFFDSKKIAYL
jgi:superfamily II DNA or RNA helicase